MSYKTIDQLVYDEGVIDALKRLKCDDKLTFIGESVKIGEGTRIYYFCNIYKKVLIGKNCLISSHVIIQGDDTEIGDNSRIGDFTFIPAGTIIESNVFISQHCSLTNDRYPKSGNKNWKREPIIIRKNSSIGSGCIILPGLEIGENCLLGAGSVLTKNMPSDEIWCGNPAKFLRKIKYSGL